MTVTPSLFALALVERGPFGAFVVQAAEPGEHGAIGQILYANRTAADWLGRTPAELCEKPLWEFSPGEHRDVLRDILESGAHTGKFPGDLLHPFAHTDGRRVVFKLRLVGDPMMAFSDGRTRHLLVFAEAVSVLDADLDALDSHRRELQKLALDFKTTTATLHGLIGTLKGPVRAVIGNSLELARALTRKLADATDEASASASREGAPVDAAVIESQFAALRDLADHTLHAAESADRLLANLVFHKETQLGLRKIQPVLVDLEDMLQDAIDAESGACESKAQLLEFVPPDETVTFMADPMALHRLLLNLISNARKFTPRGGKIRIAGDLQADVVVIRIEDNGTGIPPESIPRLFDISGGPTTSRGTEAEPGTGFGLQICHDIVSAHAGVLLVESEPGHGSTFTVRIPQTHGV